MASQYYGTRGTSVREWQQKLNAGGAGLAVDGIWGPKTEAAYQSHMSGGALPSGTYTGSSSSGVYPTGMVSFASLSDEEMRRSAEASVLPEYDTLHKRIQDNYAQTEKELGKLKESAVAGGEVEGARIRRYYDDAREGANNQALSRGLARSSIALNLQENVGKLEASSLDELGRSTAARLQEIDDELFSASRAREEALGDMEISKARALQKQMDALRKEQQDMLLKVQQYNNQYMAQQAQLAASLTKSASSGSSGGSKTSSSSAPKSSTANLSLYTQLRKELSGMSANDAMNLLMSSRTYTEALGSAWYDLYNEIKQRQALQNKAVSAPTKTERVGSLLSSIIGKRA